MVLKYKSFAIGVFSFLIIFILLSDLPVLATTRKPRMSDTLELVVLLWTGATSDW